MDVPASVLSQLGLKVQHALRAFTAADRKVIKKTAENYPETDFYKTDDLITRLGIGEALITMLNEKGIPTPLVHCMLRPPNSRMNILTENEIDTLVTASKIAASYNKEVDNESAYEILNEKLKEAAERNNETKAERKTSSREKTIFDDPALKQVSRTAATIITRSLLGVLGLGGRTTRRRRKLF